TYVELDLDPALGGDSKRGWLARDDRPDYRIILDAVTDAYISGERISLYVTSIKQNGAIERFQFGLRQLEIRAADLRLERVARAETLRTVDLAEAVVRSDNGAKGTQADTATRVIDLRKEEAAPLAVS
ncbi:MAG: hypothetical protein KJN71_00540, partial [Acidimicrobiia bacterium]|nr:hypothetical protein [Acidimicrobiia bacterium]